MSKKLSLKALNDLRGVEIGVSDWFPVKQDRIDAFAACTEDRNWIHTDPAKAGRSRLGSTVAHGFLLLSLLPHFNTHLELFEGRAKMAVNYGLNRVRFVNPVRSGSRIRCRTVLKDAAKRGFRKILVTVENTLEIEGEDRPAVAAEFLALLYL